eukprot:scaffold287_cov337-Pavlova_lutheri.AAC.120
MGRESSTWKQHVPVSSRKLPFLPLYGCSFQFRKPPPIPCLASSHDIGHVASSPPAGSGDGFPSVRCFASPVHRPMLPVLPPGSSDGFRSSGTVRSVLPPRLPGLGSTNELVRKLRHVTRICAKHESTHLAPPWTHERVFLRKEGAKGRPRRWHCVWRAGGWHPRPSGWPSKRKDQGYVCETSAGGRVCTCEMEARRTCVVHALASGMDRKTRETSHALSSAQPRRG